MPSLSLLVSVCGLLVARFPPPGDPWSWMPLAPAMWWVPGVMRGPQAELLPAMSAGPWSAPLGVSGHSHFVLGHMDSTWLSNPEISSLSQNLQNSG